MQVLLKQIISTHPNDSVINATVNACGSGGINGPVVVTGTTGVGTKFTARGNILGGALAGNLIVVNARSYSILPTSPSAEPVMGAA
jgi:hypothetical protein